MRMSNEMGRSNGMIWREETMYLGKRFDRFTGRAEVRFRNEERRSNWQKLAFIVAVVASLVTVS